VTGGGRNPYNREVKQGSALVVAFLALAAVPARAELVVLDDGRFLRAVAFALEGERVKVELRGGGSLTIDLQRVERIVDDEIDRSEPLLPPRPAAAAPAGRSVRSVSAASAPIPPLFAQLVAEAAKKHRLDPALVAAVIRAESNFSPRAVSPKGARGLMQLMPATARRLGVERPFDPAENVLGGTAYLSELADRYGETNVDLILAAYNAGEGAVATYGGVPPFRETRNYVRRVAALWGAAGSGSGSVPNP